MGGFFGAVSHRDCILDVFFGTDYHSHLGTRRGGMAAYDKEAGLQREIHNIENSPFRTKFEGILGEMKGCAAIGCISDESLRNTVANYVVTLSMERPLRKLASPLSSAGLAGTFNW